MKLNGKSHFPMPLAKQIGRSFDDMLFDIPKLYISQLALLYAVQPVRLCNISYVNSLYAPLLQKHKRMHFKKSTSC
jgi:hypothetical protein